VWSAPLSGPSVGPWAARASLPSAVFGAALVGTPDRLVLTGGYDGSAATAAVYVSSVAADGSLAWASTTSLPAAVFGHAAFGMGGGVTVLGGSDGSAAQAAVRRSAVAATEFLLEAATDAAFASGVSSTGWRSSTRLEADGLEPATTYYLRVSARGQGGTATSPLSAGTTMTLAAEPGPAASTFTAVTAATMTAQWLAGGNPAGVEFSLEASTAADFTGTTAASGWTTAFSSAVAGLSPNTTYYARVSARNGAGTVSPALPLGSTMTLAAVPSSLGVSSVQAGGFSVSWAASGNPAGTLYRAEVSTDPAFTALAASTLTASTTADFSGLLGNTSYFARVLALNGLGLPSAYSSSTSAYTAADTVPPAAVADLALHATDTPGVLLAVWSSPGSDASTGTLPTGSRFLLQWSQADPASVAWSTASAQLAASTGPVAAGSTATLVFSGATAGATVSARVWTEDAAGNVSPLSNVATAWASPFSVSRPDPLGDAGRG
ncbi:MAG: fibronectin type III domain-containing protein, partial [Elusimicrobia bacterium]|nr:fibronectin type III domain-containing protein [Elusimicrobiota bacterium]